jgi:thioesterase domain-containing protein
MRRKFYTILRGNSKSLAIVSENTQLIALQKTGNRRPFFIVDSLPYFIDLVKVLGPDQPVLSLIAQEDTQTSDNYSIADEAAAHVRTILNYQPTGAYLLGGFSASGIVAYEAAQQLQRLGHEVGLLVLFDSHNPHFMREYSAIRMSLASWRADLANLKWYEIHTWVSKKLAKFFGKIVNRAGIRRRAANGKIASIAEFGPLDARISAARKYRPTPYVGHVLLIRRTRGLTGRYRDPHYGWGGVIGGKLELCLVDARDHTQIFESESDRAGVAQRLQACFDEAAQGDWAAEGVHTLESKVG